MTPVIVTHGIKNPILSDYPYSQPYIVAFQSKHNAITAAVLPGTESPLAAPKILGARLLTGLPHTDGVTALQGLSVLSHIPPTLI